MSASPPPQPSPVAGAGRWWSGPFVRYAVGLVLGGVALWAVAGQRGELTGLGSELSRLNPVWIVVAVVAEFLSFVAFSRMQARLLRAGECHMNGGRLLAMTGAAAAIASSLPAGPAVSSVYAYRQYRRAGADESLSVWTLFATLACSALGLALLASAGVLMAEQRGAAYDLIGVTAGVLVLAMLLVVLLFRRRVLEAVAVRCLRLVKAVTRRPKADIEPLVAAIVRHLERVHLSRTDFSSAMLWSVANWMLDCGCLVAGYLAVGAAVPWKGLLLAYGAGQLAANLPVTPGGLGVVEGSLTVALVAYGGAQASTVAAVILYRIISFWAFLPVGWGVWGVLAVRDRRSDRRYLEQVLSEVEPPAPSTEPVP
jgi:uncharacterized protein (TIRG00374 family)